MNCRSITSIIATLILGSNVLSGSLLAQNNIVIDGGLEDTIKCPYTIGRFYSPTNSAQEYIWDWRATTRASPDLHNTCGYNQYVPHKGDGYAGIIFWDPAGSREYISAQFSEPMIAGECYFVEFYTARKSNSTRAIDEYQINFSATNPVDVSWPPPAPLPLTVSYQLPAPVTSDTWEKQGFLYTATGGETWMTFGNFQDNNNTTVTQVGNIGSVQAYYYIDDVSVRRLELGPDLSLCPGETAEIVSNITCPSLNYDWSNGGSDTMTTVTNSTALTLTITGNGTCDMVDNINIDFSPAVIDAGSDVTINEGDATTLNVTGTSAPTWSPASDLSCSNCTDPVASPTTDQTFFVSGFDSNGCFGSDSVNVFVIPIGTDTSNQGGGNSNTGGHLDTACCNQAIVEFVDEEIYVYIPNAFTPDGYGANNEFKVKGGPFEQFHLIIYNRWGEVIFESYDQSIGWDGSFGGELVATDVYIYTLQISAGVSENREYYGHVSVLR